MAYDLIAFETSAALAEEVACRLTRRVQEAAARGESFRLALSGGRISHDLFRALVAKAADEDVRNAWRCVELFWADERCVPPDHPDSNYRAASELFIVPMRISPHRVHRLEGELEPAEAAERASAELRAGVPQTESEVPALDLILLGMGEDGHIASLFPGAALSVVASRSPFLEVLGPKPPPRRVTMSYGQLAAGAAVWVLVAGQGKEIALRNSLYGGGITPLGILLQRKSCAIFTSVGHGEPVNS